MFPGCYNPVDGRLRVKLAAPVAPSFNHGIACGADFVYAEQSPPVAWPNGVPALANGALCLAATGPVAFNNGIPIAVTGEVAYLAALPTSFQNGLPFNGSDIAVEVVP